jgi:hypothetical protein
MTVGECILLTKIEYNKHASRELGTLKGHSREISYPQFFGANNTPGFPDSWAKAVSNINLYSRRYSIVKFDSALLYIVESTHIREYLQKIEKNILGSYNQ